jgi:hypothetical protein
VQIADKLWLFTTSVIEETMKTKTAASYGRAPVQRHVRGKLLKITFKSLAARRVRTPLSRTGGNTCFHAMMLMDRAAPDDRDEAHTLLGEARQT